MASLGKDLATIRKKQNLSLDDIQEATKIPKHILQSIEDGSIFTHFEENITYIRSYVRSYAKALSIDNQQIVYALDKEELGSYSGSLLQIGEDSKEDEPFDFEQEDENQPGGQDGSEMVSSTEATGDQSREEIPGAEPTDPQKGAKAAEQTKRPENRTKNVDSVDWVNMGHQFEPLPPKSKIWIGVLIVLLLGGGALYYFISDSTEEQSQDRISTAKVQKETPDDSLKLNLVPFAESDSLNAENAVQPAENQSLQTLPDTLNMVVYAAYGKLEPVRVFTDIMGSINPYWIEKGTAMKFDFVNRFQLRGQFNNLVLMLNGHVIKNYLDKFYDPDTRRIEIQRSFFENSDKWLQPAPDSLGIDAPPPTMILERPTFN